MRPSWTALALLGALLLQSALGLVCPRRAPVSTPSCWCWCTAASPAGEIHGMLAGPAAGWVQDVHFGGPVLGLSGLTKVLVGFAVGVAASALPAGRARPGSLVLVAAAVLDALLHSGWPPPSASRWTSWRCAGCCARRAHRGPGPS